mgnify:FL=1
MINIRLSLNLVECPSGFLLELSSLFRFQCVEQNLDTILQVLDLSLESRVHPLVVRRLLVGPHRDFSKLLIRKLELAL